MGIRDRIIRLIDKIDPPEQDTGPRAPCPACRTNLLSLHLKARSDPHLDYYLCRCGHASAWLRYGNEPQLVYGAEPEEIDYE